MTIHVNIGEAKTRLSELVAASLRGEEVVLNRAGRPVARLVPIAEASDEDRKARAAKRLAFIGKYRDAFKGYDTSIDALKADRRPEDRERRALGPDT